MDGTHSNCKISVTDNASNTSDNLTVGPFTIGRLTPALYEVTPVPTPDNDNTSSYTFFSTLPGAITYGGSCSSSDNTTAVAGNNSIIFNALADGTYSNCKISVDNNSNTSDNLSVSSFTIDTTPPTLDNVTIASDNTLNTTLAKTGDNITLSITSSETLRNRPIVKIASQNVTETGDNMTWSAVYLMKGNDTEGSVSLNIVFSDLAGNPGSAVDNTTNGSAVRFDKTVPTLPSVTIASNNTLYTTMAKTDDNITLSITSSEAIQTPIVLIAGQAATETGDNMTWSAAYTMASGDSEELVSLNIGFSDLAGNAGDNVTSTTNGSAVQFDRTSPVLQPVDNVTTPTSDNTSSYTFSSNEAGTINYSVCSGSPDNASEGNNPITFDALADGTHSNCKISVTDNASNTSDNLSVRSFTIGAITPALAEVTPVPTPDNDNTSSYTFFSTLPGAITYGGSCSSSDNTTAVAGNNSIIFNALADGTYSNCKISVDNNSNTSDNLSVSSFTIDTTPPTLVETTVVPSLTNDNATQYTFSSTEGGTITIGGDCSSDNNTAVADNMTVSFAALADGRYANCTITVTDSAGNTQTISVNTFTIDTVKPVLAQVIAVTTPTNDNTSSYTFSSNEAGIITYGGSCSSSSNDNISVDGNNNITFNALADGPYSNCTIAVTDNASNTSDNLPVSSFTIDTVKPVLAEVTAVTTPTNDTTPAYSFSSTEAGTNSYGGSCGSSSTSATSSGLDNVTIILTQPDNSTALSDNTSYSNCTITITDSAGNTSTPLLVNTFVVDTTAPTVSSTSPTDNLTSSVSVSENISVTFSESMDNTSVTTNTSNTTCSESFQLSSDNFSSCVQMGSSPTVSNSNRTFTVTPSLKMFYSATYKIRVTNAAKDSAGNNIDNHTQTYGFKTTSTIPITAGSAYSCFMLDNGSVKCWGENSYGQLGLGDTINRGDNSSEMGDNLNFVDLGSGRTATAIAAGNHHTCAILDNASIKCWGFNASGQLGLGNTSNRGDNSSEMGNNLPSVDLGSGRTAKAIATGGSHTCAILDNASVKCWGFNASGQLGLGNTSNRGDEPDEMGNNLNSVDLGSGRTAKVIATGGSHTCAVLDNASVKCWGENSNGQLGLGDISTRGDEPDEMGDYLPSVELYSDTATSITTGTGYTCVLLDDNSTEPLSNVKCWGRGNYGQLGNKKKSGRTSPAVNAINLGTGITGVTTARKATAITAGNFHTCAILDNSSIKCWGFNASGQLGQGNIDTVWHSSHLGDGLIAVDLGAGRTVRAIAAGDNHTCVVLDNTSVKCWGKNESGQLGLGVTSNRGDNSSEMGGNLPVISL